MWRESASVDGISSISDTFAANDGRYSATFGSVASMIALTPIDGVTYTPLSGQLVQTTSYFTSIPFSEPQGGGADYRVMTLAEYGLTPDEDGAAFTVGGFAFVLQTGTDIDAKQFGLKGNDTANAEVAINKAIIHANLLGGINTGARVKLPTDAYTINDSIKMLAFVTLDLGESIINIDFDGSGILGGQTFTGTEGTSIHIQNGYIKGVSPDSRSSQIGIEWSQVFVDSGMDNLRVVNMGGDSIKLTAVNAVNLTNVWCNVSGGSNLHLIDSSAVTVIGGAYEGAEASNIETVPTYGLTGKNIHTDNTTFGDYSNVFIDVQTERAAYGHYINNSRGTVITGHHAHLSPATGVSQIFLSVDTDNTVITGAVSVGYSTIITDEANSVVLPSGTGIVNYTQGRKDQAGDFQMLAGDIALSSDSIGPDLGGIVGALGGGKGRINMQTLSLDDDTVGEFTAVGGTNRAMYMITNRDRRTSQTIFGASSTETPTAIGDTGSVAYGNVVLTDGAGDGVDGSLNVYPATASTIGIKNRMGFATVFTLLSLSTN